MRVLLSTIGSRGDVQPLVALALAAEGSRPGGPPVRAARLPRVDRGPRPSRHTHRSRAAQGDGRPTPRRPRPRPSSGVSWRKARSPRSSRRSPRPRKAATSSWPPRALQIAARSVAEMMGIRYVFAAYCPTVLPSPHHAPPPLPLPRQVPAPAPADNRELWARDAERFNETVRRRAQRTSGLARPGPGR